MARNFFDYFPVRRKFTLGDSRPLPSAKVTFRPEQATQQAVIRRDIILVGTKGGPYKTTR
jgi:hypothetical protein